MRRAIAPVIVVVIGLGGRAAAHVAPSASDNNRYLKLTPLGDRVRLAYTVFYGDAPGAELRRAIDTNHDGAIDDAESQAFAGRIAREVAAALDVTVDGTPRPVVWSEVVAGMGTPRTEAGSFSIDLVASLCLAAPRGTHAIQLRDRFELSRPGETEIRFEDSPGITVDGARVGDDTFPGIDYKIIGPTPVLAGSGSDHGIELRFTAGPGSVVAADAACRAAPPRRGLPAGEIAGAAAVALVLGGAAVIRARRARRRS